MKPALPDISAPTGGLSFLLGVIFNQAIRSEVAWRAPAGLEQRLGHLEVSMLAAMAPEPIQMAISTRPALHPFSGTMAKYVIGTCRVLRDRYDGDPARIWDDQPTATELMNRLVAFPGIGKHKAEVGLFLLSCEYGVPIRQDDQPIDAALAHCPRLYESFSTA
jgi:uncharacterized HhH-GPD family protein